MIPSADARLSGLALALALPAATLAVLQPPELLGGGRMPMGLFAAAAALLFAWRRPGVGAGTGRAAALLLPLALASVLGAPSRARALDETALFGALVLVGLLGFVAARHAWSWRLVPVLLAVLASGAAVQAVLQVHWLYPRQAELLRTSGGLAADNLILRLEAGRPSGPFILPSSLGGFLALALPATLFLVRRSVPRWGGALPAAAAAVQLYALVRTLSVGGLAAAAGGALLVLSVISRRRRTAGRLLIVILALLLAGWFLHLRHAEIAPGPGGDPLRLRMGNWRAALEMIADRPLLGVGPGSFGTAYPRYMREGMNETRYAHNSYLQAAACWGIWILAPVGVLLAGLVRRTAALSRPGPDRGREEGVRLALAAGGTTFLLHNLIDFTLYLPGIAVPAALLLGMALQDGGSSREATTGQRRGWRLAAVAAAGFMAGHTVLATRAERHLEEARQAAEAGDVTRAASEARRAAAARPGSAQPWAFMAQLVLAHHMDDESARKEGLDAAERAVRLDPEAAILHHTLALYHAAVGERAPAYREERRAHLLYPQKQEYRPPAAPERAP